MKIIATLVLGFFACSGLFAQASAFYPEELIVTANSLNLREGPDKNSKKITTLNKDALVQFVEAWNAGAYVQADTTDPNSPYGQWFKVRSGGKTGYAFSVYLAGTTGLYFEEEYNYDDAPLPNLNWYGVYARDSFADEMRRIQVRFETQANEMYPENSVRILKTNQKDRSKFIIGSLKPLTEGYCGPLGGFDVGHMFLTSTMNPGAQVGLFAGNDLNDTIVKPTYGLAATGCAQMQDGMMQLKDYGLQVFNYAEMGIEHQDLTPFVRPEMNEINPSVDVLWFGDIDRDNKPDIVLQDCPYEAGCRVSLFLSSKASKGQLLQKICEHYYPGD